jgi:hypothetical protein
MILMAAVAIHSNGGGGRGRGRGRGRGGSGCDDENRKNSRNSVDWEAEQIEGMDGQETMSAMVELGTGVTVEDI